MFVLFPRSWRWEWCGAKIFKMYETSHCESDNKKIVSTRNLMENREFGCSNSSNAIVDKINTCDSWEMELVCHYTARKCQISLHSTNFLQPFHTLWTMAFVNQEDIEPMDNGLRKPGGYRANQF